MDTVLPCPKMGISSPGATQATERWAWGRFTATSTGPLECKAFREWLRGDFDEFFLFFSLHSKQTVFLVAECIHWP